MSDTTGKLPSREFENKYLVQDIDFDDLVSFLGDYLGWEMSKLGISQDTYWLPGSGSLYEFVRLRKDSAGTLKITTKRRDRVVQEDRSELEMGLIPTDEKYAIRLLTAALGSPPVGRIEKHYILFHPVPGGRDCISAEFLPETSEVVVEVEGKDAKNLVKYAKLLESCLDKLGCYYELVDWSIFSKYISK